MRDALPEFGCRDGEERGVPGVLNRFEGRSPGQLHREPYRLDTVGRRATYQGSRGQMGAFGQDITIDQAMRIELVKKAKKEKERVPAHGRMTRRLM